MRQRRIYIVSCGASLATLSSYAPALHSGKRKVRPTRGPTQNATAPCDSHELNTKSNLLHHVAIVLLYNSFATLQHLPSHPLTKKTMLF